MLNRDDTWVGFFEGTKRVYEYEIKDVLSSLDEAYWLLESDPQTLKDADKPLINDPEKAQAKVFEALDKLENLRDFGMSKMDHLVWEMKDGVNHIKTLRIDVDVRSER